LEAAALTSGFMRVFMLSTLLAFHYFPILLFTALTVVFSIWIVICCMWYVSFKDNNL